MLFNSYEYIFIFLPITFVLYFFLTKKGLIWASRAFLVFSSLVFYSWLNVSYLPLMMISVVFNYIIANYMATYSIKAKRHFSKKAILQFGLIVNISFLAYFKYMDFFIYNTNYLFHTHFEFLHIALPLAISFFTLQQIAFLVDCYEGLAKEKSFLDYTLFVIFFPQLIAGPIVHHKEMMPQFENTKKQSLNIDNIAAGMFIFAIGLFKKVVIADTFAIWVKDGFDVATKLNLFEAWATSVSFTFQIYFDFSGYTDMAIGAALLFNIVLPQNFNSPLKSTGIIEFWSKWHITLTNFITTYMYTPILYSFKKLTFNKAMIATVLAFLIAGLWHGASWMFVIFGGIHGIALVVNHYWKRKKYKMNNFLAWLITFNTVNIANVFFRARDWDNAWKVLGSMFSFDNIALPSAFYSKFSFLTKYGISFGDFAKDIQGGISTLIFILGGFALVLLFENSKQKLASFKPNYKNSLLFAMIFAISIVLMQRESEFIYFKF